MNRIYEEKIQPLKEESVSDIEVIDVVIPEEDSNIPNQERNKIRLTRSESCL
ncbi:hypothetical protein KKC87_04580 [Patescibacteria group bacterium]|nr:hypothetical protein [Patescibacteria group bacterium]